MCIPRCRQNTVPVQQSTHLWHTPHNEFTVLLASNRSQSNTASLEKRATNPLETLIRHVCFSVWFVMDVVTKVSDFPTFSYSTRHKCLNMSAGPPDDISLSTTGCLTADIHTNLFPQLMWRTHESKHPGFTRSTNAMKNKWAALSRAWEQGGCGGCWWVGGEEGWVGVAKWLKGWLHSLQAWRLHVNMHRHLRQHDRDNRDWQCTAASATTWNCNKCVSWCWIVFLVFLPNFYTSKALKELNASTFV